MAQAPNRSWRDAPELVFGLTRAIGTDLSTACSTLSSCLSEARFEVTRLKLSELLKEPEFLRPILKDSPEYLRYVTHMDAGDVLRGATKHGHAVALLGVRELRGRRRALVERGPAPAEGQQPFRGRAFLIESLMHPAELRALRAIYGSQFFSVAVFSTWEERFKRLTERLSRSGRRQRHELEPRAVELMNRDMGLGPTAGSLSRRLHLNVSATFEKADLFVASNAPEDSREAVRRFVGLVFGNPFHTPTRDEYGMAIAYATSSHSASLSRRVGACIASTEGDILATGTNEVPKAGGGLYWPGDSPDKRDFQLGYDTSDRFRLDMLRDAVTRMVRALEASDTDQEKLLSSLEMREAQLLDVGEFGRAVHAEMDALSAAARRGVSVRGATLYCTTFPCHVCARHIVAAGIARVVYIEAYPKSRVPQLHGDSIGLADRASHTGSLVRFEPFLGIAPRRFGDVFSWVDRKKDDVNPTRDSWMSGEVVDWTLGAGVMRETVVESRGLQSGIRSKAVRCIETRAFLQPFDRQLGDPNLAEAAVRIKSEIAARGR